MRQPLKTNVHFQKPCSSGDVGRDVLVLVLPPIVVVAEVAPCGSDVVVACKSIEVVVDVVAPASAWSSLFAIDGSVFTDLWLPSCDQFAPAVVGELCKAACLSPLSAEVGGGPVSDSVLRHQCFGEVCCALDEVAPWFQVVCRCFLLGW